uniref:Cap-specific mRNA (nucleoside-2'-O-)-methyltransferase n=1 Tax=Arcella intermedia TaxID=1963864 RepID=A0A6B2L6V4_9EUKA
MGSELSIIDRQKFASSFEKGSPNWRALNLCPEDERLWDENPHIRQVFVTDRQLLRKPPLASPDRYVHPRTPRSPYQRREGEFKSVDHWGQRKLLFSEIEFLSLHAMDEDVVVIYAGAAPGTHTNYLSDMFPRAYFYLVDPAPFQARASERIEIVQDYFSDEMAEGLVRRFGDRVRLFVSDIRSLDREMDDERKEGRVAIDMEWQMKWHEILKPKVSMLKFRLPYPPQKDKEKLIDIEKTNYLKVNFSINMSLCVIVVYVVLNVFFLNNYHIIS